MKRIIAGLLFAFMLCTLIPCSVFAINDPEIDEALNTVGSNVEFDNNGWEPYADGDRNCVVSTNNEGNTRSSIKAIVTVNKGDIVKFDAKVSSEADCDLMQFMVDIDVEYSISGEAEWETAYYIFEQAGQYLLTWSYVKDESIDEGTDCAWIDDIYVGKNAFALEDISVTESVKTIPGSTKQIFVEAVPTYAALPEIEFTSTDAKIATVDNAGLVTGVGIGSTVIRVKCEKFTKDVAVEVEKAVIGNAFLLYDESEENQHGIYEVTLNTGSMKNLAEGASYMSSEDDTLYSAEYYDGKIYAYTSSEFLVFDAKSYEVLKREHISTDSFVLDMAFDYKTQSLFGVKEVADEECSILVEIDMNNGEVVWGTKLDISVSAIAAHDGMLYAVEFGTGNVYSLTIDVNSTVKSNLICNTGKSPCYIQTMAFEHETGELYWLGVSEDELGFIDTFVGRVDLEDGLEVMHVFENITEFSGLYFEYDSDTQVVPSTGITLSDSEISLKWNETKTLTAIVTPADVTNPRVRWSSSDLSIAAVEGGVVRAIGNGTATITASTADGKHTATCTVKVTDAPTKVLEEDFEGELNEWTVVDKDGDGYTWDAESPAQFDFESHSGDRCIASASYLNETESALNPDNWLVSSAFYVRSTGFVSWYVAGQDVEFAGEHYAVYVIPADYTEDDLNNKLVPLYEGESTANWVEHTVEINDFAGQYVRVAFRHYNITDMFWLKLDDVSVYSAGLDELKLGDATKDGKVNTGDATYILRYAAGLLGLEGDSLYCADINMDGVVNTGDATRVLRCAAGLEPFPET